MLLLAAPGTVFAGFYTLAPTDDSYLKESSPDEVNGTVAELLSKNKLTDNMRPVLMFDISSIPAGETVVAAMLAVQITVPDFSGLPTEIL